MTSRLTAPTRPHGVESETLFRPGTNCLEVAHADRVGLIVDGAQYFRAFAEAAESAQQTIVILAWDFDSRTVLDFGPDGKSRVAIGNLLNRLVRRRPGLDIYVLIWDYPMIYGLDREFPPIFGLGWRPDRRVHIKYDSSTPVGACHHQKVVVVDDQVAFVGGLDLTSRRWDTCEHRADDRRRTVGGTIYPPFHDTMMAVSGEAARSLGKLARERWLAATGEQLPIEPRRRRRLSWRPRPDPGADRWPESLEVAIEDVDVAISRTTPPAEAGPSVREIESLYLDMIGAARDTIYLENQYFTAHRLGEALMGRLEEPDGPEIIVIMRLLSHGWLEALSMEALRTGLIRRLREADKFGRFRVYYPHVCGLNEKQCLDVHSKLMIVDDTILRIGSANFANRSMSFDTECDLTIEANGDEQRQTAIAGFRTRLLAEHLGVEAEEVETAIEREGSVIGAIESLNESAAEEDRRTLKELVVSEDPASPMVDIVKLADPEEVVPLDGLIGEFNPPNETVRAPGPAWLPLLGVGLTVAALAAVWRWTPLARVVDSATVMRLVQTASDSPWTVVALLLSYPVGSFLMFPRPLLTLFAVLAFGPWWGFLLAMAGIQLATVATYLVGRALDRNKIRRFAGRSLNRVTDALRHRGVLAMTLLRLVPLAPFAVIGMVAGAARVRPLHLLIGTALGTLPGTLFTTVLGGRLEEALRQPRPADYWFLGAVIVIALVAAYFLRRKLRRVHLPTQPA